VVIAEIRVTIASTRALRGQVSALRYRGLDLGESPGSGSYRSERIGFLDGIESGALSLVTSSV